MKYWQTIIYERYKTRELDQMVFHKSYRRKDDFIIWRWDHWENNNGFGSIQEFLDRAEQPDE